MLLGFGTGNFVAIYDGEKEIRSTQPMSGFNAKIEEIKRRIATGHEDAATLKKEMKKLGVSMDALDSGPSLTRPFSDSLAKIYFYLRQHNSDSVFDGDLYQNQVQVLLEEIALTALSIDKPKEPRKKAKMNAAQKKTYATKMKTFTRKKTEYKTRLEFNKTRHVDQAKSRIVS